MFRLCAGLLAIAAIFCGSSVRADEEKVPLDKLPAKIKDAVKAKFPEAEIISASKEIEDKVLLYEVQIKNKKQAIEVTVNEDGKIVEIEYEITPAELPKAVTEALDKKYGKMKILKTEDIVKGDKRYFEVLIVHADGMKKTEVQIDKDGKILMEENKTSEKEEKSVMGCAPAPRCGILVRLRERCCCGLIGCRLR